MPEKKFNKPMAIPPTEDAENLAISYADSP